MTDTAAYAFTGSPGIDGAAVVDWVASWAASSTFWTAPSASSGKILLRCVETGSEIVLHGSATQIQIGYAPGGGVADWSGSPTAPIWSGMRNITASTTAISGTSGQIRLAEYSDALVLLLAGPTPRWVFGFSAGLLIAPWDGNDPTKGLAGDALLTGRPDGEGAGLGWLVGTVGSTNTSVFWAVNSWQPVAALTRYLPGSAALGAIGGVERLIPYAIGAPTVTSIGQIGVTKYMRMYRRALPHETELISDTLGSAQSWITGVTDTAATARNHFLLWSQTVTNV